MKKHKDFFLYAGILLAAGEIWKQICLTHLNHGHYSWWHFPFQLCSIPMYVCLALPWIPSEKVRKILLTFLMDYSLLAGIFTFFDTSGLHYAYAPLTVYSYAWHIFLIILGVCAGLSAKADYTKKGFAGSTFLYLACCLAATLFNVAFYPFGAINMFYISPHYHMTQRVFRDIAIRLGDGAGAAIYILSIIAGAGIFHAIWRKLRQRTFPPETEAQKIKAP